MRTSDDSNINGTRDNLDRTNKVKSMVSNVIGPCKRIGRGECTLRSCNGTYHCFVGQSKAPSKESSVVLHSGWQVSNVIGLAEGVCGWGAMVSSIVGSTWAIHSGGDSAKSSGYRLSRDGIAAHPLERHAGREYAHFKIVERKRRRNLSMESIEALPESDSDVDVVRGDNSIAIRQQ